MDRIKPCYFLFPFLFTLPCFMGPTWCHTEAEILLKFRTSLTNYDSQLDDWNASGPGPCTGDNPNWTGIRCSNGSVFGLKLENMGLEGVIDIDTLKGLQLLRTVSFMINSFAGPFPDVNKLVYLRVLYLENNSLSGAIRDDGFAGMKALQKDFLGWNNSSGSIPKSLATLPKLLQLSLEWNHFEGRIPDFEQDNLSLVNLAYNNLYGPIPYGLSNMNPSFFAEKKKSGNNVTVGKISEDKSANYYKKLWENARLHFVRKERERFELQDLLRASAEVQGSGSSDFGWTRHGGEEVQANEQDGERGIS
ncbi:Kinase C-like zinc finger protein [Hibiscus syriacus]|uniref:Kinase C-like zinc finger protein n=1 Tax=Hibiscus syriacus TaxID=106335 RepID=A0A6A2YCD6_HIBSY|nr:Kinase C-like zinc finger protein [Hibiscus syriacus]